MQKVISVHLRGKAYQLEEEGYKLLSAYLKEARNSLREDPDQDEVMQDFEQAIAEKCEQLLGEHKTVITAKETQAIIDAMGPVEADTSSASENVADSDPQPAPIKKLYTLKDGAWIGGVCTGLGAYFNIDVVVVRLAFIILSLFTFGVSVVLYLLLMLFVPEAKTPEQKAELRGQKFNAQAVIDRAKQKYAEVSQYPTWKGEAPAPPQLSNLGDGIMNILRGLSMLTSVILYIFALALTILAFALIWSVGFGSIVVAEEFRDLSLWTINLFLGFAYVTIAVPTLVLAYISYMFARKKPVSRKSGVFATIMWIIWTIALTAVVCLSIAHIDNIREYDNRYDAANAEQRIEQDTHYQRSFDRPHQY